MSDPAGSAYRPVHYMAGSLHGALHDGSDGRGRQERRRDRREVAKGFYQKPDWVPAGMEGVCDPSTWTAEDHRGDAQRSISTAPKCPVRPRAISAS